MIGSNKRLFIALMQLLGKGESKNMTCYLIQLRLKFLDK
jgi:hypothetical protein